MELMCACLCVCAVASSQWRCSTKPETILSSLTARDGGSQHWQLVRRKRPEARRIGHGEMQSNVDLDPHLPRPRRGSMARRPISTSHDSFRPVDSPNPCSSIAREFLHQQEVDIVGGVSESCLFLLCRAVGAFLVPYEGRICMLLA